MVLKKQCWHKLTVSQGDSFEGHIGEKLSFLCYLSPYIPDMLKGLILTTGLDSHWKWDSDTY